MPIRPEWRKYYRGREWEAARAKVLRRAGGKFDANGRYLGGAKCEQCGKPDRERVWVWSAGNGQYWTLAIDERTQLWHYCLQGGGTGNFHLFGEQFGQARLILVKIGAAHLDHNPANNFEYNLRGLCQWCHLHYDAPQHKETRATRKDAARPLLVAAS